MSDEPDRHEYSSKTSSNNQIAGPVEALRATEAAFAGSLTGIYRPNELDELRDEWD